MISTASLTRLLSCALLCLAAGVGSSWAQTPEAPVNGTLELADTTTLNRVVRERLTDRVHESLGERWYRVELIVFERLDVLDYNTLEALTKTDPLILPSGLVIYENGPAPQSQPDNAIDLSPSRYCMGWPALPYPDVPHPTIQRAIGPPEPPPEMNEPDPALLGLTNEMPSALGPKAPNAPNQPEVLDPVPDTPIPTPIPQRDLEQADLLKAALADRRAAFEAGLIDQAFSFLDQRQMENRVKAINRQRHLRPLLHLSWVQAVPPREQPEPFEISAPSDTEKRLHGFISLTAGRYLHIHTDFRYSVPSAGQAPMLADARPVTLDESYLAFEQHRRMRSGELHYLDHPKLGVIVQVDPVAIPEELLALQHTLDLELAQ